jgi:hypothetical protein
MLCRWIGISGVVREECGKNFEVSGHIDLGI